MLRFKVEAVNFLEVWEVRDQYLLVNREAAGFEVLDECEHGVRFEARRNEEVSFFLADLHDAGDRADCWEPIDSGERVSIRHVLFLRFKLL